VVGATKGHRAGDRAAAGGEGARVAFCARGDAGVQALAGELPGSHGFTADAAGDVDEFCGACTTPSPMGGLGHIGDLRERFGMMFDEAGFRKDFEVMCWAPTAAFRRACRR
jgi:hypothetical protein